jgi:hypothetical protein
MFYNVSESTTTLPFGYPSEERDYIHPFLTLKNFLRIS